MYKLDPDLNSHLKICWIRIHVEKNNRIRSTKNECGSTFHSPDHNNKVKNRRTGKKKCTIWNKKKGGHQAHNQIELKNSWISSVGIRQKWWPEMGVHPGTASRTTTTITHGKKGGSMPDERMTCTTAIYVLQELIY